MLATTHFGGSGRTVLLLHGAGGRARDWAEIAPRLTDRHCVVAVDLPGHGGSPAFGGRWTFDAVLAELETLNLDNPAVVGLSLGGMLAVHWGRAHPSCPAVVSVDGHRTPLTVTANYPGLPYDTVAADRPRLRAIFDQMAASVGPDRAGTLADVFVAMQADDTIPRLQTIQCPTLVALATRTMPGAEPFDDLLAAHRRGVARDVAAAAERNPRLEVVHLDASHAAHREMPEAIARLIGEHVP